MLEKGSNIGPYQLQDQLGAGGMGEVYRALDTRVGRLVALKILPDSLAADEDRRRRFEQEARLAASLNHPNVMAIYDVGLDQHPPYIVAELVPGESLRRIIERGPVAPRKAVDIAAQIAAGLAAAHAAGIVHRDLKPDNVMITPEGTVKVLDFGVARMQPKPATANETQTIAAHTVAGSVVGTAAYMSPEQARAEEVDHRSDQFSLGLLLFEMLTGKHAFARASAVQTMSAIVEDEPPALDRPVPAQLRWVLDCCLAKDRARRYESTRDLARELANLRDHFGELATGTGTEAALTQTQTRPRAGWKRLGAGVAGGAILAWCAAAWLRDPAPAMTAYKFTPFATEQTVQTYASWSPDGKSIAFLGWDTPENWQLFVQAVDAPTAVQLTGRGPAIDTGQAPVWSPDSRMLYYRCATDQVSDGLCRIAAGGGVPAVIQKHVHAAAISPDGRTLAIWPYPGELSVFTATPPDGPLQKYAPMPFQTSQYYNSPSLRFSPDGRTILLFIALDTRGETAWLLPWPPAPGRRAFTQGYGYSNTPQFSWMPDSRHIVFSGSNPGMPSSLYLADAASGRHWPILSEDRSAILPSLSPDGRRVAYTSALSHTDIIEVPLGDGPIRTVLGSSRNEERVDASRVAPQLVYLTDRRGASEIWVKSLAEGWDRPLVTPNDVTVDGAPADGFMNPVFSPDGRRIAFAAKSRSGVHLYTVFTSGGTPVRATSANALEMCPTWSPEGDWLAYSALAGGAASLLKVRPGSGEAPQTVDPQSYGPSVPVWSPTGEWIAEHGPEEKLVLVSPDGKTRRTLGSDAGPVAWSRDGKTLYQVRLPEPALVAIDVAGGKERKLRDLPDLAPAANGSPGISAALTADEKNIVYTVARYRSEIWTLDGISAPRAWYQRLLP